MSTRVLEEEEGDSSGSTGEVRSNPITHSLSSRSLTQPLAFTQCSLSTSRPGNDSTFIAQDIMRVSMGPAGSSSSSLSQSSPGAAKQAVPSGGTNAPLKMRSLSPPKPKVLDLGLHLIQEEDNRDNNYGKATAAALGSIPSSPPTTAAEKGGKAARGNNKEAVKQLKQLKRSAPSKRILNQRRQQSRTQLLLTGKVGGENEGSNHNVGISTWPTLGLTKHTLRGLASLFLLCAALLNPSLLALPYLLVLFAFLLAFAATPFVAATTARGPPPGRAPCVQAAVWVRVGAVYSLMHMLLLYLYNQSPHYFRDYLPENIAQPLGMFIWATSDLSWETIPRCRALTLCLLIYNSLTHSLT